MDYAREFDGTESPKDVLIHRVGTWTPVRARHTRVFDGLVERREGRGDDGGLEELQAGWPLSMFSKRTPSHFQCRRSCEMQCQTSTPGPPDAQSSWRDPCS